MAKYADSLAKYIENCVTPTIIAVQGEWGSGKNSVINMVLEKLRKNNNVCINFSAWQYSQLAMEDSLQITFLNHFLDGMRGTTKIPEEISGALDIVKKVTARFFKRATIYAAGQIGGEELEPIKYTYDSVE